MPAGMTKTLSPGKRLKAALVERGWSQRDLGDVMGSPYVTISRLMTGKLGISARMSRRLGAALGFQPGYWLQVWLEHECNKLQVQGETLDKIRARAAEMEQRKADS